MAKTSPTGHQHRIVMANVRKEYTNGELTVVWQPAKCIHSEVCVKTLPHVYDPKAKPWIKAEQASTAELKAQIDKCPSGALSYYLNGEKPELEGENAVKVQILENGPLLVQGALELTDAQGGTKTIGDKTAFCRCGASSNKPFCDGSHNKINFKG